MSRSASDALSPAGCRVAENESVARGEGMESPLPIGSRLPALTSRTRSGELRWRDPARGSTVAVFLQSSDREADLEYLVGLTEAAEEFRNWDGTMIVVAPGSGAGDEPPLGDDVPRTLAVVTDVTGEAEHCGVVAGEDAILIADRWGQVYHGARGDSPATLPTPGEIVEWLKFLATQCPECGVPDHP